MTQAIRENKRLEQNQKKRKDELKNDNKFEVLMNYDDDRTYYCPKFFTKIESM